MKNLILPFLLLCSTVSWSQLQFNTFEFNEQMDIQIDSLSADTLWQIGPPQKVLFTESSSLPNALITDTINTYPISTNASFIIELNEFAINEFPYIQLEWTQKIDLEMNVDGGVIEISYDQGQTWLNVFDEPSYRPVVVGDAQWDTLYNGQAGMTGVTDWSWVAICWGSYYGTPPTNVTSIWLRFTLVSDATDTQQEGWMIDDFFVYGGVIGSTFDHRHAYQTFPVFPNPVQDKVTLDFTDINTSDGVLQIFNTAGIQVYIEKLLMNGANQHELSITNLPQGTYYITLRTREGAFQQEFIKIN